MNELISKTITDEKTLLKFMNWNFQSSEYKMIKTNDHTKQEKTQPDQLAGVSYITLTSRR